MNFIGSRNIKKRIKKFINFCGFELHKFEPNSSPTSQLLKTMDFLGINLVFDIGGNKGQFAEEILNGGYKGEIVSFEPLSDAHRILNENARRNSKWVVHQRAAVGDYNGEVVINIAHNSVSSSILPMLKTHIEAASSSKYIDKEICPIFTIDALSGEYIKENSNLFIKIDTQGFEWQVLNGAFETIKICKGIYCELSLTPLYEGQYLWGEIIERLELEGFTLWGLQNGFTNPKTGRSLQVDAIFIRNSIKS